MSLNGVSFVVNRRLASSEVSKWSNFLNFRNPNIQNISMAKRMIALDPRIVVNITTPSVPKARFCK